MFFSHRIALRLKAVMLALALIVVGSPAHAEWRRAESTHFVFYGDASESQLRDYARKLERFDGVLRTFFPVQSEVVAPKLEIYVVDGLAGLRQIRPAIKASIGGFYTATDERILAVVDRRRGEGEQILFHEYAHHFMFQNFKATALPGWFVEGFAEYFATADIGIGRVRVGLPDQGRIYTLGDGSNSWVPMEQVLGTRSSIQTRAGGPKYYAQAWLLTHYLMSDTARRQQLIAYLRKVADGVDPVQALEGTLDRTPDQLSNDMRSHLNTMRMYTLDQTTAPPEVALTTLTASAEDALLLRLRIEGGVPEADRAAVMSQARAIATRYPGDRLGGVLLARAAMMMDDPIEARSALEPLLIAAPSDAELLRLLAQAEMAAARDQDDETARLAGFTKARGLLARAFDADPTDYRVYLAIIENRRDAANFPNDNDLQILTDAVDLAPQVQSASYMAAQAMMARDRYNDAVALLSPIANNPHGGASLARSRALLAEAREKAGLAPLSQDAPPPAEEEGATEPDA